MKDLASRESLAIPEGVTVTLKARIVTVTGPRGTLTKAARHIQMDMQVVKDLQKGNRVEFTVWHGARKHVACLRTVKSMVSNMIVGVTKGFQYKMRLVYAHFPINPVITDGKSVEIRNFLGEKIVRKCPMLEGVTIAEGSKDELVISGNDIENVSQSAASITDKCRVKEKDIRKFLDGIYTSEKGHVVVETI